jgi:hypothetical protein
MCFFYSNHQLFVGVVKGIKLSHLVNAFYSAKKDLSPQMEKRTTRQFTEILKKKLRNLYNELPGSSAISTIGNVAIENFTYLKYLEMYAPNEVGPGQVYISYDPQSYFNNMLETIMHHFQSDPDIYVCIDEITHRRPCLGDGTGAVFLIDQFESTIKQMGHVVVVMSPWNNLRIFHRTAMLFEIHCAITNYCKLEIALSEHDRNELSRAVVNGVVDEMMEGLEWINFERSISSFHSLNELVKVAVKPFDIANETVANAVRDCLIAQSQVKGNPKLGRLHYSNGHNFCKDAYLNHNSSPVSMQEMLI